jgi:hypothetical protein
MRAASLLEGMTLRQRLSDLYLIGFLRERRLAVDRGDTDRSAGSLTVLELRNRRGQEIKNRIHTPTFQDIELWA